MAAGVTYHLQLQIAFYIPDEAGSATLLRQEFVMIITPLQAIAQPCHAPVKTTLQNFRLPTWSNTSPAQSTL